jgi:hypothetical protein
METFEYLRAYFYWVLLRCRADLCRVRNMMSVVDFEQLQLLSGYRQASKVCRFLKDNRIPFVVGSDGKPRTTTDMLNEGLRDEQDRTTEIRFSR